MSEYAELLSELTALPALAKSEAPAPAEAAPAAEPVAQEAPAEGEAKAEPEAEAPVAETEEEAVEVEGEVVAKSEIPEGFVDATDLVEGLRADVATMAKSLAELGDVVKTLAPLAKSLHVHAAEQGEVIKSLRDEVAALGNQGAGRKAVMRAAPAPAAPAAPKSEDLLAKALRGQSEGKLTGSEVSRLVAYQARGMSVPEDLARQIAAL
jgi:hypothetical protein